MRKMKCSKCGNKTYFVDTRSKQVKCQGCWQVFVFHEGRWEEFKRIKAVKRMIRARVIKPVKFVFESARETIGQLRKRLGYKKIKKTEFRKNPIEKEIIVFDEASDVGIRLLKHTWRHELKELKKNKMIVVGCNEHKGKLRGPHIAKAAHRDFKALGIKTKVSPHGKRGAKIELLEEIK